MWFPPQGCQVRLEEAVVFVLSLITWSLLPLLPVEVRGRVLQCASGTCCSGAPILFKGVMAVFLLRTDREPCGPLCDFIIFR